MNASHNNLREVCPPFPKKPETPKSPSCFKLGDYLPPSLSELLLSHNQLSNSNLILRFENRALKGIQRLNVLDLSFNQIKSISKLMIKLQGANSNLKVTNLCTNEKINLGATKIIQASQIYDKSRFKKIIATTFYNGSQLGE